MQLLQSAILLASVSAGLSAQLRCAVKHSATTPVSSASSPVSTASKLPSFIASSWFAGWHAKTGFPVSSISWHKYTHMTYAFAVTTQDVNEIAITPDDETVIPEFVAAAHSNGVAVSISVGGWTGSRFFSAAVSTPENRAAFVQTLSGFVSKYKFDGLDFDWEYPNKQGIGCNIISPTDTENFLLLLKELRTTPQTAHLIISAATAITPFIDASGSPSTDVSAFSQVLDFIEIMNYDVWGPWSSAVGPNSPLDDACAPPAGQQGSAASAIAAWTRAGFPKSQIVLGVASYGHSFRVTNSDAIYPNNTLTAYPPFDQQTRPTGDVWDDAAGPDVCGVEQPVGGNFNLWGLVKAGFLTSTGDSAPYMGFRFDECSQTAYVYDPTKQVEISYDSAASFTAKGRYIQSMGLRGFAMWEAGGDFQDILLDAINKGVGRLS